MYAISCCIGPRYIGTQLCCDVGDIFSKKNNPTAADGVLMEYYVDWEAEDHEFNIIFAGNSIATTPTYRWLIYILLRLTEQKTTELLITGTFCEKDDKWISLTKGQ